MKKISCAAIAALALTAPAVAADLGGLKKAPPAPVAVSPWDFAVGGKLMSDYNFRGISQSDRGAGVTAYGEIRYNFSDSYQMYAGAQGWSVKLPTDPTMELDLYAGVRPTYGALALDFGVMQYVYPNELRTVAPYQTDFTEVYGKGMYTINEMFSVGANLFYTPDWLGTGSSGTYASGTAKVTLPGNFAVSGELGRYMFGKPNAGFTTEDYTYWNAGASYAFKFATLDLRYHDTTLKNGTCLAMAGGSKWCGTAYIATLSFDLTSKDIK
jgi:uncharacterized protein (TIGR02001 family)